MRYIFFLIVLATSCSFDDSLVIAGSRTMAPLMQKTIQDFEIIFPESRISYRALGSSLGFELLKTGEAHLSASSRPLENDEITQDLVVLPLVQDMTLIIGSQDLPFSDLSSEFIHQILDPGFNRSLSPYRIATQDINSGTQRVFHSYFYPKGYAQARHDFVVHSDREMLNLLQFVDNTIGFINYSYLYRNTVSKIKILSLDGIDPFSPKQSEYPLKRTLYLIWKTPVVSPIMQNFLKFLSWDEVKRSWETLGYLPIQEIP